MTDAADNQSLDEFLKTSSSGRWPRWAKWVAVALAVILILFVISRFYGGDTESTYVTRAVNRGDLIVTVSATGNLKPINQVDVGSEQSGLITDVFVDVNDRVTKGQVIALIDPARLQDTVTQSTAQVASAQANIAQAESQLALANATLARQEEVFRLSGGKVPSASELDSARANARSAAASVAQARAQLNVSRAQLSTARTNLGKARILSPVNGVVLARSVEPGQTVASGLNVATLFTIAEDLTQMEVEVSVDEADVGQVKDGQAATFTVDAFPGRNFPARITRVNVGSNKSSTSGSGTAATTANVVAYTAVLGVSNPDELLRPGMTASADIVTKKVTGALLVPNAALRFAPKSGATGATFTMGPPGQMGRAPPPPKTTSFGAGSSQTVHVIGADGKPTPVSITIGDSDGTRTAVIGGDLKPGMKVITAQLAEGQEAPAESDGREELRAMGKERLNGGQ